MMSDCSWELRKGIFFLFASSDFLNSVRLRVPIINALKSDSVDPTEAADY